jgi:WD40 repeat protein
MQDRRLLQRLPGHADEVRSVAFSPDGTQLVSGSIDGTVKVWDPNPPTIQRLIPQVRLMDHVLGHPRFSPDNRLLVVATRSGDVHIVDPATPAWDVRTILPDGGYPVTFSGDAGTLLTLRETNRTVQRWDAATGALLSTTTLNTTNTSWRYSACTPGGGRLALSTGELLEVFETQTGRCLKQSAIPVVTETMDISWDGQLLALGGSKGTLWDVATGRVVRTLDGHRNRIGTIAFSRDHKIVATGSWDHTVRLWEVATGKELGVLTGHKATVKTCVFSPDGRTLATASDDRTVKFWNLATLREVGSIQVDYVVWVLTFSSDGKNLVANYNRDSLRCWRAPSLAEIDAAAAQEQVKNTHP